MKFVIFSIDQHSHSTVFNSSYGYKVQHVNKRSVGSHVSSSYETDIYFVVYNPFEEFRFIDLFIKFRGREIQDVMKKCGRLESKLYPVNCGVRVQEYNSHFPGILWGRSRESMTQLVNDKYPNQLTQALYHMRDFFFPEYGVSNSSSITFFSYEFEKDDDSDSKKPMPVYVDNMTLKKEIASLLPDFLGFYLNQYSFQLRHEIENEETNNTDEKKGPCIFAFFASNSRMTFFDETVKAQLEKHKRVILLALKEKMKKTESELPNPTTRPKIKSLPDGSQYVEFELKDFHSFDKAWKRIVEDCNAVHNLLDLQDLIQTQ
eukprot:gb/GECH01006474.1/.p1 GENE.gb/GECH01006474.1/~~gb/GECH01006474.1/.p1  ORF type:complete len:318 (+),score=37.81 gb/GECH01006474.1/:1-954(+)